MKKSLKPQQTAPVVRTTVGNNNSQAAQSVEASFFFPAPIPPFAGDDAE
ncbi:anacyclamide/piricyclamide family prenylated cyclic peptide [Microcoleus sp. CZ3-B4]